jgi:hypothetical protein
MIGKFLLHGILPRGDVEFSMTLLAKLDDEKGFQGNLHSRMVQQAQAEKP